MMPFIICLQPKSIYRLFVSEKVRYPLLEEQRIEGTGGGKCFYFMIYGQWGRLVVYQSTIVVTNKNSVTANS